LNTGSDKSRQEIGDTPAWNLVLVHGTPALLGHRWSFQDGLVLGRSVAGLPRDFTEDRKLSREHARFGVEGGAPFVEDVGSRNGTTVNEAQITGKTRLAERDLVYVGKHLFVVEARMPSAEDPGAAHSSFASRLLQRTRAAQRGTEGLLLVGEAGTGKSYFARAFHAAVAAGHVGEASQQPAYAHVSCARLGDVGLRARLVGAKGQPGLFEITTNGTLLIERWESADKDTEAYLLEVLRDRSYVSHDGARVPLTSRVVISVDVREGEAENFSEAKRNDALVLAFAPWVLVFPPLRERPADAILLANRHLHGLDEDAECADSLVMRIAREHWSGNIDELLRNVERAYLDEAEGDARPIVLTAFLEDDEPPVPSTPAPKGTRVASDGSWFATALSGRVELEAHPELSAMLTALANESIAGKKHLDWRALFETAWPGEPPQPRAGASRVFVAISALRKLGLDRALVRHVDGYSLDASVQVCVYRTGSSV
jgi:hypothetical protein